MADDHLCSNIAIKVALWVLDEDDEEEQYDIDTAGRDTHYIPGIRSCEELEYRIDIRPLDSCHLRSLKSREPSQHRPEFISAGYYQPYDNKSYACAHRQSHEQEHQRLTPTIQESFRPPAIESKVHAPPQDDDQTHDQATKPAVIEGGGSRCLSSIKVQSHNLHQSFEIRRAAFTSTHDRFITSTVHGWSEEVYEFGQRQSGNVDLLPGTCIDKPKARLMLYHPIKSALLLPRVSYLRRVHAELEKIQQVFSQQPSQQHGYNERSASIASIAAQIKTLSKGMYSVDDRKEQDRFKMQGPAKLVPWPLHYNRLWCVVSGPRAGILLCEACELPDHECNCPRVVDKDRHLTFYKHYIDPLSKQPSIYPWCIFTGPSEHERVQYIAWREFGKEENGEFLARHKFGLQWHGQRGQKVSSD